MVKNNGRVDKFLLGLQTEFCFLCLLPDFPEVPHYFSHTSVVPCPSQNLAFAIHAHDSSHVHSPIPFFSHNSMLFSEMFLMAKYLHFINKIPKNQMLRKVSFFYSQANFFVDK